MFNCMQYFREAIQYLRLLLINITITNIGAYVINVELVLVYCKSLLDLRNLLGHFQLKSRNTNSVEFKPTVFYIRVEKFPNIRANPFTITTKWQAHHQIMHKR